MAELLFVLFVVIPADALQLGRLEDALVGEFFDAPDESIEVDSDIVDWVRAKVLSIKAARTSATRVWPGNSRTKEFFSDFLNCTKTIDLCNSNECYLYNN